MSSKAERRREKAREKRKNTIKNAILVGCFGLFFLVMGILGIVISKSKYNDYKNSDDIRTVEAKVLNSDIHSEKRKNERRREYWKVKLSYEIDGKEYNAIKDYDYELKKGDTVKLEVYHSKDGSYKAAVTTSDAEFRIDNILFIASLGLGLFLIIVSIVAALPDKKKQ
jgi:Protein of unknown function (DUF3592).